MVEALRKQASTALSRPKKQIVAPKSEFIFQGKKIIGVATKILQPHLVTEFSSSFSQMHMNSVT